MKFNITFVIRGPAGVIEAPNKANPVECFNLASLLDLLADNLPRNDSLEIETIGVRIEPVLDPASDAGGEQK